MYNITKIYILPANGPGGSQPADEVGAEGKLGALVYGGDVLTQAAVVRQT